MPRTDGPHVLYSFPHPLGRPGIGTTAFHQVTGLLERGLAVSIVCSNVARSREALGDDVAETLTLRGVRIPHRAVGGMDRALRHHDRRVAAMLRRGRWRPDVVHGWPLGSAATFAAAADLGILTVRESPNCYTAVAYERVAAEVAALGLTTVPGSSHHPDPRRLAREEREYDLADVVLAPSAPALRSFSLRAGAPLEVRQHRYGFDPAGFPEPPADRPDGPFLLAFVGSCEPRKGVHHALRAWRESGAGRRGARFLIVGGWDPAYRRLLDPELRQPGVETVPFTSDAGAVMRGADALVLASVEEGSALVTYEAQASGCALLVSDAAGALMTDGVHGFVHPAGDHLALSGHLRRLLDEPDTLARMRAAVIEHRPELTWSAAARRVEAVYREELERHDRR